MLDVAFNLRGKIKRKLDSNFALTRMLNRCPAANLDGEGINGSICVKQPDDGIDSRPTASLGHSRICSRRSPTERPESDTFRLQFLTANFVLHQRFLWVSKIPLRLSGGALSPAGIAALPAFHLMVTSVLANS